MRKSLIYNWWLSGDYEFDPLTETIIAQAVTSGYTQPNQGTLILLDQFIRSISSIWSKLTILRFFAYNDSACSDFSRLNLKNPSANLITVNGGMTYGYGGWTGNGTDGFLDQNFNPISGGVYTQNSAFQAFFVRKRSETSNNALAGQVTGTSTQIRNASSTNQRLNSGGDLSTARDLSGEGFKAINRPDASNLNTYDDLVKTDIARASFTMANEDMTLFRFGSAYGDMQMSFHAAGQSLSEAEMNLLRNSYNTYYTGIWEIGMSGVLNVYYLAGQSNATGRGVNGSIAPELNGAVGAQVFELAPGPFPGTINATSAFSELTLGDNQTTESPAIQHGVEMRFGYEMFTNASEDVAIVKFGIGATSMATTWSLGGSGNSTLRRISSNYSVTDVWDTLRLRIVPRGFIWIQGESDCTGGLGAAYEASYKAMIKDFIDRCNNAGIKTNNLRWFTFQTKNGGAAGYDSTDYANVIAGQAGAMDEFLTDNPTYSTKIKALTYQSTDDIPLLDTQHYSTAGIDTMGTRLYTYFSQYINE